MWIITDLITLLSTSEVRWGNETAYRHGRTWWRQGRATLLEPDQTSFPQELPTSVHFTSSSGLGRVSTTEKERRLTNKWKQTKKEPRNFASRARTDVFSWTFSLPPPKTLSWEVVCAPRSGWGICGCCSSSVWWPPDSLRRWVSLFSLYCRVNCRGTNDNSMFQV